MARRVVLQARGLVTVNSTPLLVAVVLCPPFNAWTSPIKRTLLLVHDENSQPLTSPLMAHTVEVIQDTVTQFFRVVTWVAPLPGDDFFTIDGKVDAWVQVQEYVTQHTWFRPGTSSPPPVYDSLDALSAALAANPLTPPVSTTARAMKKRNIGLDMTKLEAEHVKDPIVYRLGVMDLWHRLHHEAPHMPLKLLALPVWTASDLDAFANHARGDVRDLSKHIKTLDEKAQADLAAVLPWLPLVLAQRLVAGHVDALRFCRAPRIRVAWRELKLPPAWESLAIDQHVEGADGEGIIPFYPDPIQPYWWWQRSLDLGEQEARQFVAQEAEGKSWWHVEWQSPPLPQTTMQRAHEHTARRPATSIVIAPAETTAMAVAAATESFVSEEAVLGLGQTPTEIEQFFAQEGADALLVRFTHVLLVDVHVYASAVRLARLLRTLMAMRRVLKLPDDEGGITLLGALEILPSARASVPIVIPLMRILGNATYEKIDIELAAGPNEAMLRALLSREDDDGKNPSLRYATDAEPSSNHMILLPMGMYPPRMQQTQKGKKRGPPPFCDVCELWTTVATTIGVDEKHLTWFSRDEWLTLATILVVRRPYLAIVVIGGVGDITERVLQAFRTSRRATHFYT